MRSSDSITVPDCRTTAPGTDFPTTHWTLITRMRQGGAVRQTALENLCQVYWYPIYVFLRRRGYPQHDAEDLGTRIITGTKESTTVRCQAGRDR